MKEDIKSIRAKYRKKSLDYRGFRIEPFEGTNVGYAPEVYNRSEHTFRSRTRKVSGYEIFYPDTDGSKILPSLKAAKEYIDRYLS